MINPPQSLTLDAGWEEAKLDCSKVGALLYRLRKERDLTQKQVADQMNISDKTISKWERGFGCPDVSLLGELSSLFEVNIEKILNGDLEPNEPDAGNFRRMKFFVCPVCANVIYSTGNAEIFLLLGASCRLLLPSLPTKCTWRL